MPWRQENSMCKRTLLTPASTSSRIEEPLAAACSFNLRYRGRGMSTVVRTESSFIERLLHVSCAKYRHSRRTTSKSPALPHRTREGRGTRLLCMGKAWASPQRLSAGAGPGTAPDAGVSGTPALPRLSSGGWPTFAILAREGTPAASVRISTGGCQLHRSHLYKDVMVGRPPGDSME
jgi:hypothetical protein